MNYNLIAYGSFLLIIAFIVKVIGNICYRNGNIFVSALLPDHLELCQQINKILLVGYYLVNIGYAAMTLIDWEIIDTLPQLVEAITFRVSVIVFILSILHYINIIVLTTSVQKLIKAP